MTKTTDITVPAAFAKMAYDYAWEAYVTSCLTQGVEVTSKESEYMKWDDKDQKFVKQFTK